MGDTTTVNGQRYILQEKERKQEVFYRGCRNIKERKKETSRSVREKKNLISSRPHAEIVYINYGGLTHTHTTTETHHTRTNAGCYTRGRMHERIYALARVRYWL